MTISKKLNKSLTTALITLLMLSVFVGLFSFASATPIPATLALNATGTGTAKWSSAQASAGSFSAYLTTTAATDTAEVKLPTSFLFGANDLSSASALNASIRVATAGASIDSKLFIKLFVDTNSDGTADVSLNTTLTPAPSAGVGNWVTYSSSNGWGAVNNSSPINGNVFGIGSGATSTYAQLNATALSASNVVAVSVLLTTAGNAIYVDTLGITPTAVYNLEPIALTLNFISASVLVQQTTPTAPCDAPVAVYAANGTFNNNEAVGIYFQGISAAVGTATATPTGGLDGWFMVPQKVAGTYTITALGVTSGKTFTGSITIATPTILADPSTATAGAPVTVTGTNFDLSGHINMTFNGAAWGTANVTVLADGTFSTTTTIPNLAAGTYTISITDGINTVTRTFVIPVPTITVTNLSFLTPTTGPVGSTVYVRGRGFSLSGLIDIYFAGQKVKSAAADVYGNLTGSTGITITVPDKTSGTYEIVVVDATTGISSNTATFTVATPSAKISVNNGQVGSTFTFNATNFKVASTVNVKFNGVSIANLTASGSGAISNTPQTVPDVVPGTYTITATDGLNPAAPLSFTVPAAAITLSPNAGPATTGFSVIGTNFKVNSPVTITFNGTTMPSGATTNGTGYFNQGEVVPSYPIGAYVVNATDGITFATTTFNIGAAVTALNATSGPVGSGIAVTGQGFTTGGVIMIYFDSTWVANSTATGSLGSLSKSFKVPDVRAGVHQITAFDVTSSLTTPATNFTVQTPTITIPTAQGQVGNNMAITGTLFKLNSTVSISFNGVAVSTTTADLTGALAASANFTVPSVVPGSYIVSATDGVNVANATFNVFGSGGIDQVITIVTSIQTTLATNGNFYNFTNTWFTTINAKLGTFTGNDTVASLLYSIKAKVNLPSELNFDFGGPKSAYQTNFIHITNTTAFVTNGMWGWTDATGLQYRDRGTAAPTVGLRGMVNSVSSKVFQVALPNGNYVVSVTQGDSFWFHDGMTIIANGELVSTQSTGIGEYAQATFSVTVNNGLLQLTFGNADGGSDPNWVVNGLTIRAQP